MKYKSKLLVAIMSLTITASPAFAVEGKKEVTKLVGYNVTETTTEADPIITGPKMGIFKKMDANGDNLLQYKEYSRFAKIEDKYSAFLIMDKDGDKNVNFLEYSAFDNSGKGSTSVDSTLHGAAKTKVKGTNLKSRVIKTEVKSYYVPVDPEIVSVKPVTK